MKFATKPYDITHLTLDMLLHYLGKLKTQIFCHIQQMWKKMQTNCIFIAGDFVINPQVLIFSVFKIANCSPYWLQKIVHVTVFYLFTCAINLWHQKFVTADVAEMFNQHRIKRPLRRKQDFDKKHINTLSMHSHTCRGIKISALKMQFICLFFYICWLSAEIWIFNFPS